MAETERSEGYVLGRLLDSECRQAILAYLDTHGTTTQTELRESLDFNDEFVAQMTRSLVELGCIDEVTAGDKAKAYDLTDSGGRLLDRVSDILGDGDD